MLKVLREAIALLERGERARLGRLLALTLLMGLLQMVGVASIMPFMSVVTNPGIVQENAWMRAVYDFMSFDSTSQFLFFFGIVVLVLIALGNTVAAVTNWLLLRFVWDTQHALSVRLLRRYLGEPYAFFLNRNTSALAKNILGEVREVISGVMLPGLKMLSQSVVALVILILLVLVDSVVAVTAIVVFGGSFGLIYLLVRRKQGRLGRLRSKLNSRRYRASMEALGGIKETKILRREREFLARFMEPSRRYSDANASNAIMSEIPKFLLETLAFGGIVVLVLYQISARGDVGEAIAVISLYALAGYRLMPSLQQIFHGLAKIRFFRPALDSLYADLQRPQSGREFPFAEELPAPMPFNHEIRVDRVSFRYPGVEEDVLREVSLTIPKNSTIGFVGATGSGKTTFVDILLGLLEPTSGQVLVDGQALRPETLSSWRALMGYVPQHIFLYDDTITQNIAFGLPADRVDPEGVRQAARLANLAEFVDRLPNGYDTVVGDRGIRLSGGQRQRIGIARALYEDPEVLFFDEATSALDGVTEDSVMNAIGSLAGGKTIILVAHRLTTLRACDNIFLFKNGQVHANGTYEELIAESDEFRAMAKLAPAEAPAT